MIKRIALLTILFTSFVALPASASPRHHHKHHAVHHRHHVAHHYDRGTIVGGRPAGCPHRYCGCGVSLRVFGRIIPFLNVAFNWRVFEPAAPAAGRVAYRAGHVFYIEGVNPDGTAHAYDPNSGGGRTRIHDRSLAGYHVVDPHKQNGRLVGARSSRRKSALLAVPQQAF